MTSYGADLVRQLKGEKEDEKNALEILGLSPEILNLDLTPDELYEYCKRTALSLLSRVHPDVQGGEERPAVKEFTDALERINKRDYFDRALDEFRQWRSYGRASERTLRSSIGNLESTNERLRNQSERNQNEAARNARVKDWTYRYIAGQTMQMPKDSDIRPIATCSELTVITFAFKFSEGESDMSQQSKIAEMYKDLMKERNHTTLGWKQRMTRLQTSLKMNKLATRRLGGLIREGLKSTQDIFGLRWSFDLAVREMKMPKLAENDQLLRVDYGGVIRETVPGVLPESLVGIFREMMEHIPMGIMSKYVSEVSIVPQVLNVEHQRISGDAIQSRMPLLLLGSVDFERAFLRSNYTEGVFRVGATEHLLTEVQPFVGPERILVSVKAAEKTRVITNKRTGGRWENIARQETSIMHGTNEFFISHIVLAAK